MNLTSDLLKKEKRLDERKFTQPRDYTILEKGKEILVQGKNTLLLVSLQKTVTSPSFDRPGKGFFKIFGCDTKLSEIFRKCINFEGLAVKDSNLVERILVKVRVIEGNSLEAMALGINKILEIHEVPVLYFPEVFVFSVNEYFLRDPSKLEMDGVFVLAKAKGIVLYAELVGGNCCSSVLKKCLDESFLFLEESFEKNKKIKR